MLTYMATIRIHTTAKEMQHLQEHLTTMRKYSVCYKTQIVNGIISLQYGFYQLNLGLNEGYLSNSNIGVISIWWGCDQD